MLKSRSRPVSIVRKSQVSFLGKSQRSIRRKSKLSILLVSFAALLLVTHLADARSLGGGKSIGRQSNNYSQRQAPAPESAPPSQQRTAPAAAPAQTPNAAPQPQRNRWLGPLAGVAAGLGMAALFSHFGMGAAFAENMGSMLLIALLVMVGLFLWRRARGSANPLASNTGAQTRPGFDAQAWQSPPQLRVVENTAPNTTTEFKPTWSIPANFDTAKFLHSSKVFYVRLQAAWDKVDLEDIREFTTPEMFAEIKLQLNERGAEPNITDVMSLNAELLGIEELPRDQLASVRFTGTLRPAPDAPTESFDEVWNLTKSPLNPAGWVLAGIQQAH
ncbi:MAG: import inner rane translocase subunit Tim44 [Verrucomicrobiaceae bacterium]|nr:import inner rane translocase subunit Tim44 [Verrucomicrobiaceae bacterium]